MRSWGLALTAMMAVACDDPVHCYEYSGSFCVCQKGETSTPGTPVASCKPGGSGFRGCEAQPGYPDTPNAQCVCDPTCCIRINSGDCNCGGGCDANDTPVATCTGRGTSYCKDTLGCVARSSGACSGDTAATCGPNDAPARSGYTKVSACL